MIISILCLRRLGGLCIFLDFKWEKKLHKVIAVSGLNPHFCFGLCVRVCLFRGAPMAYGGYQARGRIRATAAGLHHSSGQRRILNPLSKAKDWTWVLMDTSRVHYHWATSGTPKILFSESVTEQFFTLIKHLLQNSVKYIMFSWHIWNTHSAYTILFINSKNTFIVYLRILWFDEILPF